MINVLTGENFKYYKDFNKKFYFLMEISFIYNSRVSKLQIENILKNYYNSF